MIKDMILLLLIGHYLADYYFQIDYMVQNQTLIKVLIHCLLYWIIMILAIVPLFSTNLLLAASLISLVHLVIDVSKFLLTNKRSISHQKSSQIYLIDQVLHHLTIFLVGGLMVLMSTEGISYISTFQLLSDEFGFQWVYIWQWLLAVIIIYRPASITIKKILKQFEPDIKVEEGLGKPNAGALIGIFERFILLCLLHVNQLTAIGFVLTAKSIARYNKLTEDSQFAEYYLLGTLLSSLIVMVVYYLIF